MLEVTQPFTYEVIRSKRRKRITLRVREGKVELLLPPCTAVQDGQAFLNQHKGWVHKKLREHATIPTYPPKQFVDGERFDYLGESYALIIAYTKQPTVMLRDKQLFVFIRATLDADKRKHQIQQQLRRWYWQQAEQQLQQKSHAYAALLQVNYRSIAIKQFKSRWGSCSINAEIEYTWQIIMAPHAIIDYLVVHELAHIQHHNHSPQFWQLVATIIPDYKITRRWLKTHGHLLRIE